ncbi:MAG: PaaI family thioesterase [Rhizomicrobium sp.]
MFPTILDCFDAPPCARHLSLDILDARPIDGWVRVRFEARPEFANGAGNVQGGFLTAMLDDTMGPAVLLMTDAKFHPVTIALTVNFLGPARTGPLIGEAQVIQLGKTIAFVEACLGDESGRAVARASASVKLVPFEKTRP